MTFTPIPIPALHACWPKVRKGLERIAEKGKENWLPEDVYVALRTGRATLYVADPGFFILEKVDEAFTHQSVLNIWCLHAQAEDGGHHAGVLQFRDEAIAYIDGVAKSLGIKRIKMSGRKGWQKVLKDYFTPVRVMYERSI